MGAMAVVEPQSHILTALLRYNLQSPVGLIRMMIQQSNCFIVVERGAGMQNLMQERQLAESGQARQGSNMGGGQMVAADFVMTPAVVFSENNAGGVGAGVAGVFGRRAAAIGAVAGGLKFKEAQTSMLVADSRSGVQVAAAEGSTRKADMRLGGLLVRRRNGGGRRWLRQHERRKNHRRGVHGQLQQRREGGAERSRASFAMWEPSSRKPPQAAPRRPAPSSTKATCFVPKIANIKLLAQPTDTGKVLATLARGDELVVIGGVKDGFVNVQSANASGWIKVVFVEQAIEPR